jgi:uncharacterized protein
MNPLSERLTLAWADREGPAIFATSDQDGNPNVIYVGEIWLDPREGFIIADNYFHKTRANIQRGTKGAVLFLTKNRQSFQVKGAIDYHADGPLFAAMRARHDPKHPGIAAAVLRIQRAFRGSEEFK